MTAEVQGVASVSELPTIVQLGEGGWGGGNWRKMGIIAIPNQQILVLLYTVLEHLCQLSVISRKRSVCNCQLNNIESLQELVETVVNRTLDSKLLSDQGQVNASINKKIDISQQDYQVNYLN